MKNFKVWSDVYTYKPRKYIMSVWEKDTALMIRFQGQCTVKVPNFETEGLGKEDFKYLYEQIVIDSGIVYGEIV